MKNILLLVVPLIYLFAQNQFYSNTNIIDIGRTVTSDTQQVPSTFVYYEPTISYVDNITIYNERVQGEQKQCENDFLNTETCPSNTETCPSHEEFDNGYSTQHTTIKTFLKRCDNIQDILVGEKCYSDPLQDGSMIVYPHATGNTPEINIVSGYARESDMRLNLLKENGKIYFDFEDTNNGTHSNHTSGLYLNISELVFQGSDEFHGPWHTSIGEDSWRIERTASATNGNCITFNNAGNICLNMQTLKWSGSTGSRRSTGRYYAITRNNQLSLQEGRHYTTTNKIELSGSCPNGEVWSSDGLCVTGCPSGYETEGEVLSLTSPVKCFKSSICPDNTVVQADGSCKMQYDWYSYHCNTDVNFYQNNWQVRDGGRDCGNPTCTNSAIPPINNCVRNDYTCPFDEDVRCGKTTANNIDCGDGYVWNDNRCERIDSYCGSSTYNASLDICQNITHYTKLCQNPSDVYDVSLNKCVSNTKICKNGTYDNSTKTCTMGYLTNCRTTGYTYDENSDLCIDNTLNICPQAQYSYDSVNNQCLGEMTVCDPGYSYNETTKKCEKELCGILSTTNNNTRCETTSQCDGTLTASGNCIPNVVQQ